MLMHNPSALNGGDIGGVTHLLVAFEGTHAMVGICVVEMERGDFDERDGVAGSSEA